MKIAYKIILFFASLFIFMLLAPFFAVRLPADYGMGVSMIFFFCVYPLYSLFLGVLSASDIKRLFWIPLAEAALFPLLFSLAVKGMVWELYVYSGIYAVLGYLSALTVIIIKRIKIGRQRNINEGN